MSKQIKREKRNRKIQGIKNGQFENLQAGIPGKKL